MEGKVRLKRIGVAGGPVAAGCRRLLDSLGEAFDCVFEERALHDARGIDAWMLVDGDRASVARVGRVGRPCYVALRGDELVPCGSSKTLALSTHLTLPSVLRGREITEEDTADARALPVWLQGAAPVAFKEGRPVWAVQGRGRGWRYYVGFPLPEVEEDEAVFSRFNGARFVSLLPLLLFVRAVAEEEEWTHPPLLASFMFDDPNLHRPTYGFIRFEDMLRNATTHNYHVAIATIPLDSWFVHAPTAALFRENGDRLSLLVHGNDHVANELARPRSAEFRSAMLRQALGRIARMEQRKGLTVARVMVPPHGACSEESLAQMAQLEFEAACISRGSLRYHNRGVRWGATIGLRPCDIVEGLPVLPRFAISGECMSDVLIAAILRQPIVAMAHHQALAGGYRVFEEVAARVNALGTVTWTDMSGMTRALYAWMRDGERLIVRMFTKRASVRLPSDVEEVSVERRWLVEATDERLWWRGDDEGWQCNGTSQVIEVRGGGNLDIASRPAGGITCVNGARSGRRAIPMARRVLTEARDRTLPSIHRFWGALRVR